MYLALDLDGTLGDFASITGILSVLRQSRFYKNNVREKQWPNPEIEWKIDIAYDRFVKEILISEKHSLLGIFRPGIFSVFKEIVRLKKTGLCKGVIIYSNNGSIVLLEFVRDVLNYLFNFEIFDDLIDFYHPLRPRVALQTDIRKNWVELKRLLVEGKCKAPPALTPEQVVFVDDQIHTDLVNQLGPNYIKIAGYSHNVDVKALMDLYKRVLVHSELLEDKSFQSFTRLFNKDWKIPTPVPAPDFSIKVIMMGLKKIRIKRNVNNNSSNNNMRTRNNKKKARTVSMKNY